MTEKDICVRCEREVSISEVDYIPHVPAPDCGVSAQYSICKPCQETLGIQKIKLNDKGLFDIHVPREAYEFLEGLYWN